MIPHEITLEEIPRRIILNLVENDAAPPLSVTFVGLDLSTYASINLLGRKPDGGSFSRVLTPVGSSDPETGTVEFEVGDLIPGDSTAEFEFDLAGDKFRLPEKYPIIFRVRSLV